MKYTENFPLVINTDVVYTCATNYPEIVMKIFQPYSGVIKTLHAKAWYKDDQLHREDGPAVKYIDGSERYWLEGCFLNKEDWKEEIKKRGLITPDYFKNQL